MGESIAEVAAKLTKARKAMLLALPANGEWGRVPNRAVAKRAWWNMLPPLIDHKHCPGGPNEEWGLTAYGIAVRNHLISQGADHDR